MNKDNAKEFLPLVQALADGKTIQFNIRGKGQEPDWEDLTNPHFPGDPDHYRVKPEPLEFDCWVASGQKDILVTENDMLQYGNKWRKIRVREIL